MAAFAPTTNQTAQTADLALIQAATTLVFKVEFLGSWIIDVPNYTFQRVFSASKNGLAFGIYGSDPGFFDFFVFDTFNGPLYSTGVVSTNIAKASYNAAKWYNAYCYFGPLGRVFEVIDDTGTSIFTSSEGSSVLMPTGVGNGIIRAGFSSNTISGPVSGIAIHSAAIVGTPARWAVPTAADPNLVSYQSFKENTGTTAADEIVAVGNWTLSAALWTTGGRFVPFAGGGGGSSLAGFAGILSWWKKKKFR
jgi:hypothetical protein